MMNCYPLKCLEIFDSIYDDIVPGSMVRVIKRWHYDVLGELFQVGDVCLVLEYMQGHMPLLLKLFRDEFKWRSYYT